MLRDEITFYEYTFKRTPVTYLINVGKDTGKIERLEKFCRKLLEGEEQEQFLVFALDSALNVLGFTSLYKGSKDRVDISNYHEIFKLPVRLNSNRIIVVHNHTSGPIMPSPKDEQLLKIILEGAHTLGIIVEGFLIIGDTKSHMTYPEKEYGGASTAETLAIKRKIDVWNGNVAATSTNNE